MKARENPFAANRVESIRYAWRDGGLAPLLARLRTLDYRAAIVGGHGTGKTTLLEDLEQPLVDLGFRVRRLRLDTEHPRFARGTHATLAAELDARDLICFDGAEQLDAWHWIQVRWATRRAGGVIITSHRHGRLPTLIECTTSAELLDSIVQRLTPTDPSGGRVHTPTAQELFSRHRGNLRDALRELYDVYAATQG